MSRRLSAALLGLALCLAAGCSHREKPRSPILVEVNGEFITVADLDYEKRLKQFGFKQAGVDEDALLEEMIDRLLMLQQARQARLQPSQAELDALIKEACSGYSLADLTASLDGQGILFADWQESLRQQWIIQKLVDNQVGRGTTVTEQEIKDYYWEHLGDYSGREKRHLRQIVTARLDEAEKARQELALGDDFAQVSARHSIAPEASQGGDLGWVASNALPANLAEQAFKLKPGVIGEPVRSPWGYHLMKVDGVQPAGRTSLASARAGIKETLMNAKQQAPYKAWLLALRREAVINRLQEKEKDGSR